MRFSRIQSLTLDLLSPSELLVRAGSGFGENVRSVGLGLGDEAWLTGNGSKVTRVVLVGAAPGELWRRAGL